MSSLQLQYCRRHKKKQILFSGDSFLLMRQGDKTKIVLFSYPGKNIMTCEKCESAENRIIVEIVGRENDISHHHAAGHNLLTEIRIGGMEPVFVKTRREVEPLIWKHWKSTMPESIRGMIKSFDNPIQEMLNCATRQSEVYRMFNGFFSNFINNRNYLVYD